MPDPTKRWDVMYEDLSDHVYQLKRYLTWAVGEGKSHRVDCICATCENIRDLCLEQEHFDGSAPGERLEP